MSVSITLWLRQVLLAGRADAQSLMRRVCLQLGSFPCAEQGFEVVEDEQLRWVQAKACFSKSAQ